MLIIIAKMDIFIKKSKFCHHLPTLMSTTLTLQKVQKEIVKIIHMWFSEKFLKRHDYFKWWTDTEFRLFSTHKHWSANINRSSTFLRFLLKLKRTRINLIGSCTSIML